MEPGGLSTTEGSFSHKNSEISVVAAYGIVQSACGATRRKISRNRPLPERLAQWHKRQILGRKWTGGLSMGGGWRRCRFCGFGRGPSGFL